MILVGNQRGGAKDLALHLMKDENERVQVHEIRGFVGNDLMSALRESYAISKATRCKQHMFSLSLNPPKEADVSTEDFEAAIVKAEERLGLTGQPRAIVFHEKYGDDGQLRRHAHAVWCRIDTEKMKAVQLSHSHNKLQEVARELYIEHGWNMPRGFLGKEHRNPRNFTLEEWQQAKRAGKDPKKIKGTFQDCWAVSDSRASFAHALQEHGYFLAQGRRGHVAVDYKGEKYAISKWVGIRAKQVPAKLGEANHLPTVDQAHAKAAGMVTGRLKEMQAEQSHIHKLEKHRIAAEGESKLVEQMAERERLDKDQAQRSRIEEAQRQARLRRGLFGLWDRVTGKRRRTELQNQFEAAKAKERDAVARQQVKTRHENENKATRRKAETEKSRYQSIVSELKNDIDAINTPLTDDRDRDRETFKAKRRATSERPKRRSRRTRNRDGPNFG